MVEKLKEYPLTPLQNDTVAKALHRAIAAEQESQRAGQRALERAEALADVLNLVQGTLKVPGGWVLTDDQPYRFVPPKS